MVSNNAKIAIFISIIILILDLSVLYMFNNPRLYERVTGHKFDAFPPVLSVFVLLPILVIFILGMSFYFVVRKDWILMLPFVLGCFIILFFILIYYYTLSIPVKRI